MKRRPKLSRTELCWARAALGAIYPAVPSLGFEVGILDMDVEGFVDDMRARVPAFTAFGLRFAIWFVALAPIFVIGRARTIAGLGEEDRVRVLATLASHRVYFVRQMALLLKAMGGLLYGSHPAVRARCTAGAGAALASGTRLIALGRKSPREAAA